MLCLLHLFKGIEHVFLTFSAALKDQPSITIPPDYQAIAGEVREIGLMSKITNGALAIAWCFTVIAELGINRGGRFHCTRA